MIHTDTNFYNGSGDNGENYPTIFFKGDHSSGNNPAHGKITVRNSGQNTYSGDILLMPQGYYGGSYGYEEVVRVSAYKRVGINTSFPDAVLTIKGDTDATTLPSIRLKDGTDTREVSISNVSGDFVASTHGTDNVQHGFIKLFDSGMFTVATGGTGERFRIDTNGLISNSNRAAADYGSPKLLISGNNSMFTMMGDGSINNSSYTGIKFRVAGGTAGDYTKAGIFALRRGGYNDLDMLFCFNTTADATGVSDSNAKVRIKSDGRLLMGSQQTFGNANYYDDITVNNSNNASGAAGGTGLTLISGTSSWNAVIFGDTPTDVQNAGWIKYTHGGDAMLFATGGTERIRIDSNGDINLGSNPTNQYGYKLNIQDSAIIYAQTASSGGLEAKWHLDNSAQLMELGTVTTDDLALVTNNTARLYIRKSTGHVEPAADNTQNLGSDARTWDNVYYRNAYPDQGTEQSISGSSFSNGTWYETGFRRDSVAGLDTNGTYIITAYADLYQAMGANYAVTYTWIVGLRDNYTNQTLVNSCPLLSVCGHSTNNAGATSATVGDGIRLGTSRVPATSGGQEKIVWKPSGNCGQINNTAGRTLKFRIQRIGRSSLG